jgi:light-harvesting complex I chlorophyll a/b binding protein 1
MLAMRLAVGRHHAPCGAAPRVTMRTDPLPDPATPSWLDRLDEFEDEEDMPDDYDPDKDQTYIDFNFVADYGFDPLGIARFDLIGTAMDNKRPFQQVLRDYREAELRHGRLAMMAAIVWPLQELSEPMLMTETAAGSAQHPSVLNGGLEQGPVPALTAIFALLVAAVDVLALRLREERGENTWLPGDFNFDPLNILGGAPLEQRRKMQAREIDNGRLAMCALVVMAVEEALTGLPVTEVTPWLFEPVFMIPQVREALDSEFAVAAFRPT